ncbi:MAG: helix-turn-helix domain-containing protein [Streptosporangiales bacterium]|nr:helix-turn-helix domain-containing protein [Streptosporangiales bacterium]
MRSVERAFDVLGVLEEGRVPLRLSEVARRAGLHVATTQRLLNVLIARGYAVREDAGYQVGPGVLTAAHAFLVGSRLGQAGLPVLQQLAATTGLAVSLFIPVGDARVQIARVEGRNPLRYLLPVGEKLPLHLGAGKSLLPWLPEAEREAVIATVCPFVTAAGVRVGEAEFREELRAVRDRGYAISVGERVADVCGVSAPIQGGHGLAGGITAVARVHELDADDHVRIGAELLRAAGAIATRLP